VHSIRLAIPTDAAAIAEVYLASFKATYDFPLAHTDEAVRAWVRDVLPRRAELWVAEESGRILAMLAITPGWIEQLYVAPGAQGRGIGRALLETAKQRSPDGLQLWTFQVNVRAQRFYVRNGFVAAERTDGAGNEERQPDVRFAWSPAARGGSATA